MQFLPKTDSQETVEIMSLYTLFVGHAWMAVLEPLLKADATLEVMCTNVMT